MSDGLFIEGSWQHGSGDAIVSHNPATGELLWEGTSASAGEVDSAITAAADAFPAWRRRTMEDRLVYVRRFSDLLAANKEKLGRLIAAETGKALWDALGEAGAMAGKTDISVRAYEERTGTTTADAAGAMMQVTHRPHGPMAVVGPFNFPGHLPNGHIVPALIAGNTIVFKPSEITPMVAEETVRLWEEAGLPPGVVNLVQGGRAVGEQLVADTRIAGVLFTGGVEAGAAIHKAMAGQPDRILALELGGNNPLIAWDVADKQATARVVLRSAYISSGQRCTCARRLIVPDTQEGADIIAAVDDVLSRIHIGDPMGTPAPFMGSLISARAATDVLAAQDDLIAKGARAIRKATRHEAGDAFLSPGLLDVTDVPDRPDREVFGPLLQVIRVPSFEAALDEANNTRFGLAAGLLSDRSDLFEHFSAEIRAGIVNWNRQTTGASSAAPFGGVGLSGNHRPAGYYAADYCAWPMASLIAEGALSDDGKTPGLDT